MHNFRGTRKVSGLNGDGMDARRVKSVNAAAVAPKYNDSNKEKDEEKERN